MPRAFVAHVRSCRIRIAQETKRLIVELTARLPEP
jgi:hypothetical protein